MYYATASILLLAVLSCTCNSANAEVRRLGEPGARISRKVKKSSKSSKPNCKVPKGKKSKKNAKKDEGPVVPPEIQDAVDSFIELLKPVCKTTEKTSSFTFPEGAGRFLAPATAAPLFVNVTNASLLCGDFDYRFPLSSPLQGAPASSNLARYLTEALGYAAFTGEPIATTLNGFELSGASFIEPVAQSPFEGVRTIASTVYDLELGTAATFRADPVCSNCIPTQPERPSPDETAGVKEVVEKFCEDTGIFFCGQDGFTFQFPVIECPRPPSSSPIFDFFGEFIRYCVNFEKPLNSTSTGPDVPVMDGLTIYPENSPVVVIQETSIPPPEDEKLRFVIEPVPGNLCTLELQNGQDFRKRTL